MSMSIEEYRQLYVLAAKALNDIDMYSPRYGKALWNNTCALKYAYISAIKPILEDAYSFIEDALQEGLELPSIPELEY